MASSSSNSKFVDITSVAEFIEGQENEYTKKKTRQCSVKDCRRNSLTRTEFIHQRIYRNSTKEKENENAP